MIKESILPSINPTIPIILASGSESRKVMLEDAGIKFDVITSHVDEDILKQEIYVCIPVLMSCKQTLK